MAKSLLADYKLKGDVIDRLAPERAAEAEHEAEPSPVLFHNSSGDLPDESPPVGLAQGDDAITMIDSVPSDELTCERDGLFQVFTVGEISYRLGGVKSLFVTSLRVNIRASNGEASYYDSLDLYMARSRGGFAAALHRAWGAEPSRVERDLVLILEHLERERDEALRAGNKRATVTMSAADRELGMELLKDTRLFTRIVDDLSALGYVGEELNKILLYVCASSRKLPDPISVLILSQSASGKSFLVDSVKRLMPPEDVVAVTSLSDQALNYIDDLTHKFLVLGEAVHGDVVEHQIREMLSGKELSRLVTVKDPETGKMQSRVVRTPVIVSSVMSGTSHAVNPENASRCFLVNTDESREQTERIHTYQRQKYSLERLCDGRSEVERIVRTHHAAQRLLQAVAIVNDFAPLLSFPTALMRTRRDHDRFLDLIASVCYLRQYQKREAHEGGLSFIRCDLEDYRVAYRVMVEGVLSSTLRELPAGAQLLYEAIRKLARSEAQKQRLSIQEISMTQRQIREATGLAQTAVRMNLRELVEFEYLVVARGGGERSKGFYRLKEDAEILKADLSMIPTPEAMEKLIKASTNHA